MLELRRPRAHVARVGHRGAAALAPENTLRSLELAIELGCDMLEFDVLALSDRTLDALRGVAPNLPTFDDALAYLAARFPKTVLQIDLKQRGVEEAVVAALRRHGVVERSWVSGFDAVSLRRVDAGADGIITNDPRIFSRLNL